MIGLIFIVIGIAILLVLITYLKKGGKDSLALVLLIFFGLILVVIGMAIYYEDAHRTGLTAGYGMPLTELPIGKEYQVLNIFSINDTIYLVIKSGEKDRVVWYQTDKVNASRIEVLDRFSMVKTPDGVRMKSYPNY
ncbi:MAG: hypothetical protein WC998_05420 [Candidatus Paceibacterota bacterium]|jgi:hypothetical protein